MPFNPNEYRAGEEKITAKYVTSRDFGFITERLRHANLAFSFRPAGEHTINRLDAGSGAKPHDILEKSVKFPVAGHNFDNIKGFIGHWRDKTTLQGLYLTGWGYEKLKEKGYEKYISEVTPKMGEKQRYYLNFEKGFSSSNLNNGLDPYWQTFFFTGDYDLHDIFTTTNPFTYSFYESDYVKKVIDEINDECRRLPVGAGDKHEDDYNRIQHGPQISYLAHMLNEEMATLKDPDKKVSIVRPVAYPSFPIAIVCKNKGEDKEILSKWFIFEDLDGYKTFINEWGNAKIKLTWEDETEMDALLHRIQEKYKINVT